MRKPTRRMRRQAHGRSGGARGRGRSRPQRGRPRAPAAAAKRRDRPPANEPPAQTRGEDRRARRRCGRNGGKRPPRGRSRVVRCWPSARARGFWRQRAPRSSTAAFEGKVTRVLRSTSPDSLPPEEGRSGDRGPRRSRALPPPGRGPGRSLAAPRKPFCRAAFASTTALAAQSALLIYGRNPRASRGFALDKGARNHEKGTGPGERRTSPPGAGA